MALQRVASKLTIGDILRLNVLCKRLQKKPCSIKYEYMHYGNHKTHLTVFSDAGLKKEEKDGYAIRGATYLRHCEPIVSDQGVISSETKAHLLHVESRSIKTVCRSTYAAELMASTAAADVLIPMAITMMEIQEGPIGTEKLKLLRENGWGCDVPIVTRLTLVAKSALESLKALTFKPPSENTLAGHVLWLREMMLKKLICFITWVDTRDMLADGLTKGSVPRDRLEDAMEGKVFMEHNVEQCVKHKTKVNLYVRSTH